MKTAMQELIYDLKLLQEKDDIKLVDIQSIISHANDKLEKEKEQIIKAGNGGVLKNYLHREKLAKMSDDELRDSLVENPISYGEQYYNETYQNK